MGISTHFKMLPLLRYNCNSKETFDEKEEEELRLSFLSLCSPLFSFDQLNQKDQLENEEDKEMIWELSNEDGLYDQIEFDAAIGDIKNEIREQRQRQGNNKGALSNYYNSTDGFSKIE